MPESPGWWTVDVLDVYINYGMAGGSNKEETSAIDQRFFDRSANISAIGGKTIFGLYRIQQEGGVIGCKLFVAWDSKSALDAGKEALAKELQLSASEFDNVTEGYEGKMWTTDPTVPHKAEPQAGKEPVKSVLGIGVYHLNCGPGTTAKVTIDKFVDAFSIKAPDMAKINGKSHFGYYYKANESHKPTCFMLWDDSETKQKGKVDLWNIMMETKGHAGGQTQTSVHTLANGGMFKADSDRTYHEALISASVSSSYF